MNPMMNQMMSQMLGQMAQQNPMIGMMMQMMQGTKNVPDARKKLSEWIRQNPNNPAAKQMAEALVKTSGKSDAEIMEMAQSVMAGMSEK